MRNKSFLLVLMFLICLIFSTSGFLSAQVVEKEALTIPEWARKLPANTSLVIAVENLEAYAEKFFPQKTVKSESAAEIIEKTLKFFNKEIVIGLLKFRCDWPDFIIFADIEEKDIRFSDFLQKEFIPFFETTDIEIELRSEKSYQVISLDEDLNFFFTIRNKRMFLSNNKNIVEAISQDKVPFESTLAENEKFTTLLKNLQTGDFLVYCNIRSILKPFEANITVEGRKIYQAFGIDKFDAIGYSARMKGDDLEIFSSLTFEDTGLGLPKIFAQPNTSTSSIDFVPPDYAVYGRFCTADASGAWDEMKNIVRKIVDDIAWRDFNNDLKRLKQERGVDLEEDIVGNLGDEIAFALKFPPLAGTPSVLLIAEIKNEEKAQEAISRWMSKIKLTPVEAVHKNVRIYSVFTKAGLQPAYAIVDKHLIFGLSPTIVMSAVDAKKSKNNLKEDRYFKRAADRLPEKNAAALYVDTRRLNEFLFNALRKVYGKEMDDEQKEIINILLERYAQLAERIHPSAAALSTDGNTINIRYIGSVAQAELAFSAMAMTLAPSTQKSRRIVCAENIKQILLGCYLYANDHKGNFPDKLSDLYPNYVSDLKVFQCPAKRKKIRTKNEIDAKTAYILIKGITKKDRFDRVAIYEPIENHGDGCNVGFVDGHVKWVEEKGLEKLLSESK